MRKSNFQYFNLFCLFLSGVFVLGIVWIWRDTLSPDHLATALQPTMNSQQMTDNSDKEIKKLPARQADQLAGVAGGGNLEIIRDEDSSTSTSVSSVSAQNDEVMLPKEFLLSVPFTSQAPEKNWEQPWQDACEEAALLMLDAYYKKYNLSPLFSRDEILKMVTWEEEKNWGGSIEIEKVKQMAEEYFLLSSRGVETTRDLSKEQNVDKTKINVDNQNGDEKDSSPLGFRMNARIIENPTIEQIKNSIAKGNPVLVVADGKVLPNPHFRNGGPVYHALVIKGYDGENFITNDPGTQFGESFKYKYDDLMNAIHDWNDGDVKEGRKVVLVLE